METAWPVSSECVLEEDLVSLLRSQICCFLEDLESFLLVNYLCHPAPLESGMKVKRSVTEFNMGPLNPLRPVV